uniref:Uncharacterized protein LOC114337874 n=1 Tax=Diabrotica virgifera virgifera TaxID=50390 RepID=A0A6P7GGM3_DIAVI
MPVIIDNSQNIDLSSLNFNSNIIILEDERLHEVNQPETTKEICTNAVNFNSTVEHLKDIEEYNRTDECCDITPILSTSEQQVLVDMLDMKNMSDINNFLNVPNTPARKGVRQTERSSFVLTSSDYKTNAERKQKEKEEKKRKKQKIDRKDY